MKVGNSEQAQAFKDNEELLKRMNKGLEHKISAKEKEIKQVGELYDKKIEAAKKDGEEEYVTSLDRNQNRMIGETNQYEEKIKGYQDRLKKAHETVQLEEKTLRDNSSSRLDNMKMQLEENFQEQFANTQENQRAITASTQESVKNLATKAKSERSQMESNSQYKINALSNELNSKSANIEKDFREQLTTDVKLHQAEVSRQRDELKKVMTNEADRSKRLSDEKMRVNNDQLTFQDQHQQEMLKQRDADFKVRYENMVKEHEAILKDLGDKLEVDKKKMVQSTSSEKKVIDNKTQDPFYRVDTLKPKMVEDLKTVTVSMPVAEHEKENVHLSTQGRVVKITLSRKFTDNMKEEDGSLNRSTRSELFSKELATTDLLSPKDIKQSYENGILSFLIQKA